MIKATKLLVIPSLLCAVCMLPALSAQEHAGDVEHFLEGKLAAAESLLRDEQYRKALELSDALLALSPAQAFTKKVSSFRQRLLDARVRSEVLECRVVPDKNVYIAGEPVRLTLRIYNRSLGEVAIPLIEKEDAGRAAPGQPAKEPNRLLITMVSRDYDALGSVLTTTTDSEVKIEEEIRLSPGDFWEKRFTPRGITEGVGGQAARRIEFSVGVAPLMIKEGARTRLHTPYRSAAFRILVVAEGARGAMADPEAAFRRAVEAGDATGVFRAAMLLSAKKRNRALRLLAAALRGSRPNSAVERAVIVGMQHIVGVYRRRTRDSWLKWWDRSWTYWCVDDDGEDESALRIALIKRNENYLITLNGQRHSPPELVENLAQAVARGAVRAEIRCGGNVALAQFVELHRAAREAGLQDIRVLYADAVQP